MHHSGHGSAVYIRLYCSLCLLTWILVILNICKCGPPEITQPNCNRFQHELMKIDTKTTSKAFANLKQVLKRKGFDIALYCM